LAGHGFPANEEEVRWNIVYLSTAKWAIDNGMSKYDFKHFMIDSYRERKCSKILTYTFRGYSTMQGLLKYNQRNNQMSVSQTDSLNGLNRP